MQNYHMDRCKYNYNIWSDVAAYKQESYIGHAFRIWPSRGTPKSKNMLQCNQIIMYLLFYIRIVIYKVSLNDQLIYPNPLGSGPQYDHPIRGGNAITNPINHVRAIILPGVRQFAILLNTSIVEDTSLVGLYISHHLKNEIKITR